MWSNPSSYAETEAMSDTDQSTKAPKLVVQRLNGAYRLVPETGRSLRHANQFLVALGVRGLSAATVESYAYDLVLVFRWLKKRKRPFASISSRDLLLWIQAMKEAGMKPASINRRLSSLESFYKFCFGRPVPRADLVSYPTPYYRRGAAPRVRGLFVRRRKEMQLRVKAPKPLIDPLEVEEVNRFLEHISHYRDLSIVLLMLFCGLRSCEVLSLKTYYIDFERARIRVLGKGNRERAMPLPERVISVMRKYLRFERPNSTNNDHFFVILKGERRGQPMTRAGLRRLFRYWREISGVHKARPHAWRHCFGTNMARHGVGLPTLQKMMGHADFKTTLRYINLAMQDVAEEYSRAMTRINERYDEDPI